MIIYEAVCEKCKETFNPTPSLTKKPTFPQLVVWDGDRGFTTDDLTHGVRINGEECGGMGTLMGHWSSGD